MDVHPTKNGIYRYWPIAIFVAQKQGIGHHGLKARVADSRNGFGVVEVHLLRKGVSTGRWSDSARFSLPICSMYGIFTNIYLLNDPNVGKYTIHGAYGLGKSGDDVTMKRREKRDTLMDLEARNSMVWSGDQGNFEMNRKNRSVHTQFIYAGQCPQLNYLSIHLWAVSVFLDDHDDHPRTGATPKRDLTLVYAQAAQLLLKHSSFSWGKRKHQLCDLKRKHFKWRSAWKKEWRFQPQNVFKSSPTPSNII